MNFGQHLQYERESLGRYSRDLYGGIKWGAEDDDLVLCSIELEFIELSSVIHQFTPGSGSLIFFWGDLAVPSVMMDLKSCLSHLPDIEHSFPDFWIYAPGDRVVVEISFSGVVTAARVPQDAQ